VVVVGGKVVVVVGGKVVVVVVGGKVVVGAMGVTDAELADGALSPVSPFATTKNV
jgi:hypothetical protein